MKEILALSLAFVLAVGGFIVCRDHIFVSYHGDPMMGCPGCGHHATGYNVRDGHQYCQKCDTLIQ